MARAYNIAFFIKNLEYVAHCIGECIVDIQQSRAGRPIYYNIDFGLLCPVLFLMPGTGSKSFLSPPTASTRRVLTKKEKEGGYDLVVSGPTIIEFFDQLNHTLGELQKRKQVGAKIPSKYSVTDEASLRKALFSSDELRADLSIFTKRGLDRRVRQPIKRLLELLEKETLRGTADVLDADAIRSATDVGQFRVFFEQHRAARARYDKRDMADSEFHYRIDAANACLTLATVKSPGPEALFVTPTSLNIRQCTVGQQTYARFDRTPLFMLNASRLRDVGVIRDELRFLEAAGREATEILGELREYDSLNACPGHLYIKIGTFYELYVSFIARVDDRRASVQLDSIDEIMQSMLDTTLAHELLEDAAKDLRDGAKLIEKHASELVDLAYIDDFDFGDDPILASMRHRLGVLAPK